MFEELLEKLAQALQKNNVPYMIIGGQAVLAYGDPRLTRDIDLTLGWDSDRLSSLLEIVSSLGWKILVEQPETFVKKTMVLPCQDPTNGIRIDIVFSFTPYETEAIQRATRIKIGKTDVCFASVEDLVIHKMVAGRPRDWEDIRNVALKNPAMDKQYILYWLRQFEDMLEKPLLEKFKELTAEK